MTVAGRIDAGEELGRRVFSERAARRARRSTVPYNQFLVKSGDLISVDRLSNAVLVDVAVVAQRASESRDGPFRGWASVPGEIASRNGRRVEASATADNPYHGDIRLPDAAATDRIERKRHAQELADASRWCERPSVEEGG